MFVENETVQYKGMTGTIVFITASYVVMELLPAPDRNPARLLIFQHQYSMVQREK
jgi:hypothetical protein